MRSISRAISAANSCGLLPTTSACCAVEFFAHAFVGDDALERRIELVDDRRAACLAGAISPKNATQFRSSMPTSAKVGTFGNASRRVRRPEIASARSLPLSTIGSVVGRLSNSTLNLPADRVLQRRPDTAIRHMLQVGVGRQFVLLAHQMADAAIAGRTVGQLVRRPRASAVNAVMSDTLSDGLIDMMFGTAGDIADRRQIGLHVIGQRSYRPPD